MPPLARQQQLIDDSECLQQQPQHLQKVESQIRLNDERSTVPTNATTATRRTQQTLLKTAWDIGTLVLSLTSTCITNTYIRDRGQYETDQCAWMLRFCEVWFFLDTCINLMAFYREYLRSSSATDTTTTSRVLFGTRFLVWFGIAIVSMLLPWWDLTTLMQIHTRRHPLHEAAVRTRGTIKTIRSLKKWHISLIRRILKQTKCVGIRLAKIVEFVLHYLPRYATYFHNMKAILALRLLKLVQLCWQVQTDIRGMVCCCCYATEEPGIGFQSSEAQQCPVLQEPITSNSSSSSPKLDLGGATVRLGRPNRSMILSLIRLPAAFLYKQTLERRTPL